MREEFNMRNTSKSYPKVLAGLLLGTAIGVTGSATAQETMPLRGPQIPIECLDPVTGALVLTRENFHLCEAFVAGLTAPQGPLAGRSGDLPGEGQQPGVTPPGVTPPAPPGETPPGVTPPAPP
jgi:hypothetical protein